MSFNTASGHLVPISVLSALVNVYVYHIKVVRL